MEETYIKKVTIVISQTFNKEEDRDIVLVILRNLKDIGTLGTVDVSVV